MLRALSITAMFVLASAGSAPAQSFDCKAAGGADEVAICRDAHLAQLDTQLAQLYGRQRQRLDGAGRATLAMHQKAWLGQRRDCRADAACIGDLYADRIKMLTVDLALPAAIGDCITTTIAEITDRFGDRLASRPPKETTGTAVSFGNGAYQVSYDWEATVARARAGEPVRMCLVSVPKDCPPGDDRGRVYTTTNLRTHEHWTLPDSQHSCGGA
jgi:uncharacterized protein YecT (DUF1311 family)